MARVVDDKGTEFCNVDGTGVVVLMLNNRGLQIDVNGGVFGSVNKKVLSESIVDLVLGIDAARDLLEVLLEKTAGGAIKGVKAYERQR
jgi:hypothetical protein